MEFPLSDLLSPDDQVLLRAGFTRSVHKKGDMLVTQQLPDDREYLLLGGMVRAFVLDGEGREAVLGLYVGPSVISPNMARCDQGMSLVTLEMLSDGLVASMSAPALLDLMVARSGVRAWGNAVMQQALVAKARREWCLAALPAAERLDWFRNHYPDGEQVFGHAHIASFLGMTPVTFSRARAARKTVLRDRRGDYPDSD